MSLSLFATSPKKLKNFQKIPIASVARFSFAESSLARRNNRADCLTTSCPRCNKRSIVQRSPNTFDCLNCNFHKQLPPVRPTRYSPPLNSLPLNSPPLANPSAGRSLPPLRSYRHDQNSSHPAFGYGLDDSEPDDSSVGSRPLGQGSLSRLLDTSRRYAYREQAYNMHSEINTVQPLVFAVIAVIIGLFIL